MNQQIVEQKEKPKLAFIASSDEENSSSDEEAKTYYGKQKSK